MNKNPVVVPLRPRAAFSLEQFGPYRRCYDIGEGGRVRVVAAQETCDDGLQRTVALKVLHPHLARQADVSRRFLDEARVLANVVHPNVCRVFDFGEIAGQPFVATEYLVGEPLSKLLPVLRRSAIGANVKRRTRLFAGMIADLAEGLHAAHETCDGNGKSLSIVHRDIAPSNLFLLYDGSARVTDFGIARYRDRPLYFATTAHLCDKLAYMAPEQVLSEPIDRRVDVWGLGAVLFELITLTRVFQRRVQLDTMRAICSDPIPKLHSLVDGVPPGLDLIMEQALGRIPALRYQTTLDFAQELRAWLLANGGPVTRLELAAFLNGFFSELNDN